MGTFSIWHWVIVLLWIGVYLIPVALADKEKRMTRKPYAIRTVGFFVGLSVLGFLAGSPEEVEGGGPLIFGLIVIVAALVFSVLLVLWSAHRTQDAGLSKWWCLLFIFPIVAFVFWIVLFFLPTRTAATTTS